MAKGQAKYKFVGEHAEDLASGQMVEPGEYVHLSDEEADESRNQDLMAQGKLIGTGSKSEDEVETAQQKAEREAKAQQKAEERKEGEAA